MCPWGDPACSCQGPLLSLCLQHLLPSASIQDAQQWLHRNRFSQFCRLFASFSGAHLCVVGRTHGDPRNTSQSQVASQTWLHCLSGWDPVWHGSLTHLLTLSQVLKEEVLSVGSFESSVTLREDHLGPLGWVPVCPGRAPCTRWAGAHSASLLALPTTLPPVCHTFSGALTWGDDSEATGRRGSCGFLQALTGGAVRQRPGARAVGHNGKQSGEPCHHVETVQNDRE